MDNSRLLEQFASLSTPLIADARDPQAILSAQFGDFAVTADDVVFASASIGRRSGEPSRSRMSK